jgi:serine protease
MAAPHVAGVVALMKSIDPSLRHAQIEAALKQTAVSAYQCSQGCGAGLLNAYAAILRIRGQTPQGNPELFVPTRELMLPAGQRASIPVANRGGGTLTVQASASGEFASRITFPTGAVRVLEAAQADAIDVAADTSGLADGLYGVNVNLNAGSAGAVAVRVNFRVGTAAEGKQGFIAAVYLDDMGEWQIGDGVGFVSAPTVDYEIAGLEPREYYLIVGVDDNGNGELFDDGERMGIYLNLDAPLPVEVLAGEETAGVDFPLIAVGAAPGEDNRPVPVGAPCETKADCGAGGLCDTTLPGGYCWKECPNGPSDCPSGSTCYGAGSRACLVTCASPWSGQSNCRSGYLCWDATPAPTCIPPCDDSSCGEGTYCDHATGYCTYL